MEDQWNKNIFGKNSGAVNRQLLQNQSYLYYENEKLHEDVTRLTRQLAEIKSSCGNPEFKENFKKEKENLASLNNILRKTLKQIQSSGPAKQSEIIKETKEKKELYGTIRELTQLIEKIRKTETFEFKPQETSTAQVIDTLTKKLEREEKRSEAANEVIRKLREDDEKYILREKISDIKNLLTELEVDNSRLKFENEQLLEDVENYKKQLNEALEEAKIAAKKCCTLEDEKDQFKKAISDLENEKIQIKKDMIEEMNEANRAKRVSVDTELALQHISEAYENKRQEVKKLMEQLDAAEKLIKGFQAHYLV